VWENRALGSPFGQPGRTAREPLAPSGALRPHSARFGLIDQKMSGSTQQHQVH